eukprot:scaffold245_cov256-Pinguiococcus_pyrenoidosus.AAC.26
MVHFRGKAQRGISLSIPVVRIRAGRSKHAHDVRMAIHGCCKQRGVGAAANGFYPFPGTSLVEGCCRAQEQQDHSRLAVQGRIYKRAIVYFHEVEVGRRSNHIWPGRRVGKPLFPVAGVPQCLGHVSGSGLRRIPKHTQEGGGRRRRRRASQGSGSRWIRLIDGRLVLRSPQPSLLGHLGMPKQPGDHQAVAPALLRLPIPAEDKRGRPRRRRHFLAFSLDLVLRSRFLLDFLAGLQLRSLLVLPFPRRSLAGSAHKPFLQMPDPRVHFDRLRCLGRRRHVRSSCTLPWHIRRSPGRIHRGLCGSNDASFDLSLGVRRSRGVLRRVRSRRLPLLCVRVAVPRPHVAVAGPRAVRADLADSLRRLAFVRSCSLRLHLAPDHGHFGGRLRRRGVAGGLRGLLQLLSLCGLGFALRTKWRFATRLPHHRGGFALRLGGLRLCEVNDHS